MFSNPKLPQLTPLSSRDDDYALLSDSDMASLSSSEFTIRSPSKRNRINSDSSVRSYSGSLSPKTPKNRRDSQSTQSPGNNTSSRSRSRGKRKLSKAKDDLPPAANIFKNLLIMEESLRQQVSAQRALRHKYLLFLTILFSLLAVCCYNLFMRLQQPTGYVRVSYQFVSLIIVVTLFLYYISGEYHRTIVLPRRFLSSTNKGLRQLNVRLTKVKTPLSDRLIDSIRYSLHMVASMLQWGLDSTGPLKHLRLSQYVQSLILALENRAQPRVGATEVKLVLNPRIFGTSIRENWEMYRNEFWAREGARRRGANLNNHLEELPKKEVIEKDRRELIERDRRERKERRKTNNAN